MKVMPSSLLHAPQLAAHAQPQILVQRRERLVQQQHARVGDQRARQRHALLLAAGKLRRQAVGECLEPAPSPAVRAPACAGPCVDAAHLQRERDVVEHAADAETARSSGTSSPCPAATASVRPRCAADQDVACGRRFVSRDHAQDRRLAAAARPQQAAIGAVVECAARASSTAGACRAKRLVTDTSSISPFLVC